MNVASSSRSTSGWVLVSRSASTCGQSISWAVVIACFLCSSDFGRSLEESRDDLHLSGYDTPDLTIRRRLYTTLLDATLGHRRPPTRWPKPPAALRCICGLESSAPDVRADTTRRCGRQEECRRI